MSISTLSAIGMACGPPLIYVDQAWNIVKREDSTGFSTNVPLILITANIIRVFFWLGEHFELALLIQSLLMIVSQLGLLYLCLKFAPEPVTDVEAQDAAAEDEPLTHESQERENASNKTDLVSRPFIPFTDFGKFLELFAGLVVFLAISYFIFGSFKTFISMLGILAIGIESTLPVPQLLTNLKRRSTEGFRATVLAGWTFGDAFKLVYFVLKQSPWQFLAGACFALSVDLGIAGQFWIYR